MERLLKIIFFGLLIKPIVLILLGLNVRGRDKLPINGPAIIVANHNSHLDTLVLMSLYPLSKIHKIRPVAAADYFLGNGGLLTWFFLKCIGIIPMRRDGNTSPETLFSDCHQALNNNEILIFFPEGSRGQPEKMSKLKKGIFFLIKDRPNTQVIPVMMHGLGRALPRGKALLVPFNCDVVIGNEIPITEKPIHFMSAIAETFDGLSEHFLTRNNI